LWIFYFNFCLLLGFISEFPRGNHSWQEGGFGLWGVEGVEGTFVPDKAGGKIVWNHQERTKQMNCEEEKQAKGKARKKITEKA